MTAIRWQDTDALRACVQELIGTDNLLARVTALLHHEVAPGMQEAGANMKPPKKAAPPSPWNDHAAALTLDIHAGARDIEANLTRLAHGRTTTRSGSDAHTRRALANIPDLLALCNERHGGHWIVTEGEKQLLRWPRECRAILDEARWGEEPWTKAPGGLRCPHCSRRLALAPGWDKEAAPPVWCRACPAEIEGDERARPHRQWASDTWIGLLNEPTSNAVGQTR